MLKALNVNSEIVFTSKDDKTEPKTEFILKPLTSIQKMEMFVGVDAKSAFKGDSLKKILLASIKEVRNFDIKNIDEVIDVLPIETITELTLKVIDINGLTADEQKN